MKTILEWFDEIEDEGIKAEAISNYVGRYKEVWRRRSAKDLGLAIAYGFSWMNSPQGQEFWAELVTKDENGEKF